jgi:hypothetical protein
MGNNTGAYPSIDMEALYPGLAKGMVPLQEREGGNAAVGSGNLPAMSWIGFVAVLVGLRVLWMIAK